ncbi:MAG: hypothetical protein CNCCGFBP_00223 [Fimbriimonadaceae bacterium]|nr:hypothetical protein [Fimbriimonadaceae bacterium]
MIDSLKISIPLREPLTEKVFAKLRAHSTKNKSYRRRVFNCDKFQIVPPADISAARISAQCSLPKFAKGSNVEPLSLDETILAAREFIEAVSKELELGYTLSFDEVRVVWADIVFDWIVETPEAYLAVLRHYVIERANHHLNFIKNPIDKGSTINVGSKIRNVKVYNKEAQVEHQNVNGEYRQLVLDKAQGRLRTELRITGDGWNRYVSEAPTLDVVLKYVQTNGRRALADDWLKVTQGWESARIEADLSRLISRFGATKGRQVCGTLALIRAIGVPAYRQICKPSPSNFYIFRSDLKKAGVSLTDPSELARLSIPWFDLESWRAKRAWSFYHLATIVSERRDEFEVDGDGNAWDISIQNTVTVVAWEVAS